MARNFAFLHGGGQGSWVWDEVTDALRRQAAPDEVKVLALDVPGCGVKRGRNTEGMSIPEVVAELVGDIERAGLKDVVLAGHSMAGLVLPGMARARPDLFRHVAYVSCSIPAAGQSGPELMGEGLHGESDDCMGWPVDRATTPYPDFIRAMFCNDMDEAKIEPFLALLGKDWWPTACWGEYRPGAYDNPPVVPSTFVVLLQDQSLTAPWQLRFAERLGIKDLVKIDAGHQVMQTRPHALAEVLLALAGAA